MAVRVAVGERRVVDRLDARRVAVHEEQRGPARSVGSGRVGHHDVEVRDVARRDEPLLPAQTEAPGHGFGGRRDSGRVGARVALRHGVGVLPLAAEGGTEVAVDLLGRAETQDVVAALDGPPDGVRRAAELLVHEHGLDGGPALPAEVDRVVAADEPELARSRPHALDARRLEAAVCQLRLHLERDELLVDERRGPGLQLQLGGCQPEIHGVSSLMAPSTINASSAVAVPSETRRGLTSMATTSGR